ncbi:MAG: hypothetical protein DDT21_02552 [Syntrophomonadaceae bacterium]|nr:hypothetical protein [Bacillota bacterium]
MAAKNMGVGGILKVIRATGGCVKETSKICCTCQIFFDAVRPHIRDFSREFGRQ